MQEPLISGEDTDDNYDDDQKDAELKSPGHYMINLLHISACFFLVFTAFSAIQNLAASEYHVAWIGTISLAILYVCFTLTCIVGPFIYAKLGIKWSISIALMGYTVYALTSMVAVYFNVCVDESYVNATTHLSSHCTQFDVSKSQAENHCSDYAKEVKDACCACGGGTSSTRDKIIQMACLFPGGAICGISASFLWTAQGAYVAQNGQLYHKAKAQRAGKVGEDVGNINLSLGLFNGIFFGIFQATQITGNVLAGILRSLGLTDFILFLIYVIFAVLGSLLAFFLRSVAQPKASGKASSFCADLLATLKLLVTNWTMVALIPLCLYNGLEMGFVWGDYTTYYADKGLGSSNMPFVMAVFGGADVLASVGFGKLSDIVGRLPIVLLGAVAQVVVLVTTFFYTIPKLEPGAEPTATTWVMLMAGVVLWGIGDAVWNTQIFAILGENFGKDQSAAFANFKMWQSLATAVSFSYNATLGTVYKKIILLSLLGIGLLGYFVALISWRSRKQD